MRVRLAPVLVVAALLAAGCASAPPKAISRMEYSNESARDVVLHLSLATTAGRLVWARDVTVAPAGSGNLTFPVNDTGILTLRVAADSGPSESRNMEAHGYDARIVVTSSGRLSVIVGAA